LFFQIFNVFNARPDERSALGDLFRNAWLRGAVALSLLLQVTVIHVPFLRRAFSTAHLSLGDWLLCTVVASSVLWLRELSKIVKRVSSRTP
jgi:Ca2+-transporting ATPase